MKNIIRKILTAILVMSVLLGGPLVGQSSDVKMSNKSLPLLFEANAATSFDEEGSAKIQEAQVSTERIQKIIPSEVFGGMYFDENQNLVVNVTDLTANSVLSLSKESTSETVVFKQVEYSLEFLENVRTKLTPFMAKYNIATIDANEVTNKIDIELYEENKGLEDLLSKYIKLEDVSISVLSDDVEICFSHEKLDETISGIQVVPQTTEEGLNSSSATTTLYPGWQIIKGGYGYTVGPRCSSSQFKTAGHAALDSTSTSFYITVSGINRTVGTMSSYSCGFGGDHMTVNIGGLWYSLPSTNRFGVGTGTYTITSNCVVGTAVEMHGAKSGISSGKITATHQSVYVADYGITIYNLVKASYTCQKGDSGAGVFSNNAINVTGYCYGTQSIGVFQNGSSTSSYSYFSYI